jgi:hypothetical protein
MIHASFENAMAADQPGKTAMQHDSRLRAVVMSLPISSDINTPPVTLLQLRGLVCTAATV